MGLSLVVGPAHAGKVALLLERYLEVLEQDPWLVVPNRHDVDRVERDLLRRRPALLSGRIGTFDDLFEHVVRDDPHRLPLASDSQRTVAVRRAISSTALDGLAASSSTIGFADALLGAVGELESALLEPEELDGDLGRLSRAYRSELDRLGRWDRDTLRRRAAERLTGDLDAWHGEPVFAYGFEDLTGAEWTLVEGLAGRADITVSLPYEPGRVAFAALERTVTDLAAIADAAVVELRPRASGDAPAALSHLERWLYVDSPPEASRLDGSIRFLEGAGTRGTSDLLAAEMREHLRDGVPPHRIGVVCDSVERWRSTLDAAFPPLGVPYAIEAGLRLGDSSLGRALLALLRFGWLGGRRSDLYAFLRSPFSGIDRRSVDFAEGRLRGRAVVEPARVEEETERLRGAPIPALVELRRTADPVAAARTLVRTMTTNAWGVDSPPTEQDARADASAFRSAERVLDELAELIGLGVELGPEDVVAALERASTRPVAVGEAGRIAVLDYTRARTRVFEVVFLLGLEEGSLPRRDRPSPFLDDAARRALGRRLERTDAVARDRHLFYTACTRATRRVVLVREAVSDDGLPREPSPLWDDVRSLFAPDDIAFVTRRRPLSSLTWPLETAPDERERLRAVAQLSVADPGSAEGLAAANGWSRRLERARAAFHRPTGLTSPVVLDWLSARTAFGATELERFADCSSAWLVDRVIDPKKIDAEPDALLRGQIAHAALSRFYALLPKELDAERVTLENLEPALGLVRRSLDEALESGVRLDLTELQAAEFRQTLLADLQGLVRDEAESEVTFVPRRFEVGFGSDRAAPELQRGLSLGNGMWLSGKIDRIDVDPFSARGIVQDYKSGAGAYSARNIDRELRLQIPLYILALRDLVGLEPMGGVYRALSGKRVARGMLRKSASEDLPGFTRDDYLDEETFWQQVEGARERAGRYAERIRAGDVRHDPRWDGSCPAWCDLWPMCRVARA